MILWELCRYSSGAEATLGFLFSRVGGRHFEAYTLEDQAQARKMPGETRIPAGTYPLALRTEGGFHQRYAARFGQMHKGMLWLQEVPGFDFVLLHCGNTDLDTRGCILLGDAVRQNLTDRGRLEQSEAAYRRVYPILAAWLAAGQRVELMVTDFDSDGIPPAP